MPAQAWLAPLTLQPLLENAIRHGIEPLPEGGAAHRAPTAARPALDRQASPCAVQPGGENRMAQQNLRARLLTLYGPRAPVLTTALDGRYRARLEMPLDGAS